MKAAVAHMKFHGRNPPVVTNRIIARAFSGVTVLVATP